MGVLQFRGEDNKDKQLCPVYNMSRWKDNHIMGKKVPKKVLRYFSIIPRLQHLYKSSHTTKEMTWHATGKCTELGKMQHPVDGRAWKNFDTNPKSLGNDIDVYLRPLIDDLKDLWAKPGVETLEVATGQKFNMRAMVLCTINNYLARSILSGWSEQGYKACSTCNEDTPYTRVLGKTTYVGHRRFLKKPHKWRRSLDFNGGIEDGDPPRKFERDDIMAQLARLPTRVKGKHPMYGGVKIKRNVLVELNWTKRSIFYELEYRSFFTLKHNLDVMHIKKNLLESILNTLLMNDKSKDTTKARQDLKRLGIQSSLWLGQNKNRKCMKPQAAYSFTPRDKKKFCQFIKGVKLPDGFGSNFKHKVIDNDTNITRLKSHDCHIMMQHLLPYGLQQYLPADVAKPIIELCLFFKKICSQTLMEDDMLKAQSKVVDILCNLELRYPPGFFDIMIHLVIHLPLEALEGGPIRPRQFPNKDMKEEFLGWCGSQIRQRYVDKDPGVSASSELFALACGPTPTPISINSCVVNGVRRPLGWKVVEHVNHKKFSNGGVIVVEDDRDIIYVDNSSDLALATSLNDLEITVLHIDGQSIDVDAPPDIIDVDEDDDIIDDEHVLPHDLADSDDEDLVNVVDDDGVAVVYSSEEEDYL
ncbi:zinc finger, PHD-type containing protein [Tanacetum coccineum]